MLPVLFRTVLTAAIALGCAIFASDANAAPRTVGFRHLTTDRGVEVGIWYPANAAAKEVAIGYNRQTVADNAPIVGRHHPLIIISHGNGGSYAGHYDTAIALAQAGFVVVAPTHPGDNWADQSKATDMGARPHELSATIDFMLDRFDGRGSIDPHRIGAFGFSSGGFTVLAAAGGRPNLAAFGAHCAGQQHFFDCGLVAQNRGSTANVIPPQTAWRRDSRIDALVVAAPALGFTFGKAGLSNVRVPVQLWRADDDVVLPPALYADAVRAALPVVPDFRTVENAGHFDFLAPCSPLFKAKVPAICTSAPGFDRAAFHARFNCAVVIFFRHALSVR